MALRTIRVQGDSVLTKKIPHSGQNDTKDRRTDYRYAGYHV